MTLGSLILFTVLSLLLYLILAEGIVLGIAWTISSFTHVAVNYQFAGLIVGGIWFLIVVIYLLIIYIAYKEVGE